MNIKYLIITLFISVSVKTIAQDTIPEIKNTHKVFANIYTAGYYNFNTIKPNVGFALSTALLGYRFQKSEKLKFTLIYDVTRTTNGIHVTDTAGNNLPVYYFEGSKYTAFLKMAEIKWYFAKNFSLSAGQLLNEQYLTVQDKVWGHRYVLTTMQELFRMAMPADFGMRIAYKNKKTFALSLGANNGNGPFRHQDTLSTIEYTSNFEIYRIKNLLLKVFVGFTPATFETDNNLISRFSGFIAYQKPKYKIGFEYSKTLNPYFLNIEYSGVSTFAMYNITNKWEIFARYDYVDNSPIVKYENVFVGGFQFKPQKNLFLSLNYRYWENSEIQQLFFNLGAKF